jgi:hypothetical protein
MEFQSRILITNSDKIQFVRKKFNQQIFDEIDNYSKTFKMPYPFVIWQHIVYENGNSEMIKLCTIKKQKK